MAGGYSVTITAVDQATKTIDAVNKRLQAIRAPTEKLGAALSKFSRLSGLSDIAKGFVAVGRNAFSAFRSISLIIAPLASITGAASLAGIYRLTEAWANFATHLGQTAQRIGIAAPKLAEMERMSTLAGSSAAAMDDGLKGFRDTMDNIAHGRGTADQVTLLRALGLGLDFASDAAKDVPGSFAKLTQAIQRSNDPTVRAIAAQALLSGAGEALQPVLNLSAEKLAYLNEQLRLNGSITQQGVDKLTDLGLAQRILKDAVDQLGSSVAVEVSGPLADLLGFFTQLIRDNREAIATKIGEWARDLGDWLKAIDWRATALAAEKLAVGVAHVAADLAAAVGWMDKMGVAAPAFEAAIALYLLAPLTKVASKLAVIAAFSPPAWMAAIGLGGGAAAGAMGVPTVDDNGNVTGNWGGAAGAQQDAARGIHGPRGLGPEDDPQSLSYRPQADRFVPLGKRLWQGVFGSGSSESAAPRPSDSAYKPLLDLLGKSEGTDKGRGYDETMGYGAYTGGNVDLQHMKLSDVYKLQEGMIAKGASSTAVGRYQFLERTLKGLAQAENISPDTPLSKELQDHFAAQLARGRGGDDYLSGRLSGTDFQRRLAKEWASVPVPETGMSQYGGQGVGTNDKAVQGAITAMAKGLPAAMPAAPAASGAPATIGAPDGQGGLQPTPPPSGQATITVRHVNPPPGATVTAQTSGNIFSGPAKIEGSLPSMAGP